MGYGNRVASKYLVGDFPGRRDCRLRGLGRGAGRVCQGEEKLDGGLLVPRSSQPRHGVTVGREHPVHALRGPVKRRRV